MPREKAQRPRRALSLEVREGTHGHLDGHLRVRPVQVEEVNRVDPEAFQGFGAGALEEGRGAVHSALEGDGIEDDPGLAAEERASERAGCAREGGGSTVGLTTLCRNRWDLGSGAGALVAMTTLSRPTSLMARPSRDSLCTTVPEVLS